MPKIFWSLVSLALVTPCISLSAQSGLSVEVDSVVRVAGAAPGGEVALVAVARMTVGSETVVTRNIHTLHADGTGLAVLTPQGRIPPRSIWLAVDMTTGETRIGTPQGFDPQTLPAEVAGPTEPDRSGRVALMTADVKMLEVIVIRLAVGIWSLLVGEGGQADSDGMLNGRSVFRAKDLKPFTEGIDEITHLEKGDVVLMVDTRTMRLRVVRI